MGIYKRENTYWINYIGIDGRQIRESTETSKKGIAEQILLKRKQGVLEGKRPEIIKNYTFEELSTEYLKWAQRQRAYKSKIHWIKPLLKKFKHFHLNQFNTKIIEQYQTERLNLGLKPASPNRELTLLKHMFTKSIEWNMTTHQIFEKVRKVKHLEEETGRLRYLTKEESQNLINACSPHLKPIVVMALSTGMRKSEILQLKWDNVDLVNKFIWIAKTKTKPRGIPILDNLNFFLQSLPRSIKTNYVFYDPLTLNPYADIKRSFASACRKAKIMDFTFHDLRHTFASQSVMAGISITVLSKILGHESLRMTMRYTHLAPNHLQEEMKKLNKNFLGLSQFYHNQEVKKIC